MKTNSVLKKTNNPERKLTFGLSKTGGRNNRGRITTRHIGGGAKRLYRVIDFKKDKSLFDVDCKIISVEYDPNRTAFISLVEGPNYKRFYTIHTEGTKSGDSLRMSMEKVDIKPGNVTRLKNIPSGTNIHSLELKPSSRSTLARSAGSYATIVGVKDEENVLVRLPSTEVRLVNVNCLATIGSVSNASHFNENIGSAGRNRHLGVRPTVRGIAMNPVDHPHGGRTNGGMHPVSPWGQKAKGKKTRSNKRTDKFIVSKRKKK